MIEQFLNSVHCRTRFRRVFAAYCMVAAAAAGQMTNVLASLKKVPIALMSVDTLVFVLCILSAAFSVFATRNWLGNSGFRGLMLAVIGMFSISFFVWGIQMGLTYIVYGAVKAPTSLLLTIVPNEVLLATWLIVLFGVHQLRKQAPVLVAETRKETTSVSSFTKMNLQRG